MAKGSKVCTDFILSKSNIGEIITYLSCLLAKIMPLLVGLAAVAFVWGIIQIYLNPNNEEKKKKGKDFMLWGLVALFVIVCVWGLVGIIANTFGVEMLIPQLSQ